MPRTGAKRKPSYTEQRLTSVATSSSTGEVTQLFDPWPTWNQTYTCSWGCENTTALTNASVSHWTVSNGVWQAWNTSAAATVSYTEIATIAAISYNTIGAWDAWVQQHETVVSGRAISEAQRAEWAARDRRIREEHEARQLALREARVTARKLLLSCLSPEQREDLTKKRCFYVDAPGGRRFRIDEGTHGNVKLLDPKGSIIGSYCVQPDGVPVEDSMLAQKLWLETQPEHLGRIANFTPMRPLTDDDKRLILPARRAA